MIHLRNDKEIDAIRKSSQIVAGALQLAGEMIEEGMTTQRLADELEKYIVKHNARPAFKGYQGFPGSVCISLDDEVVHGIPSDRIIAADSVVKVDIGVELDGFYGDAARSSPVGVLSAKVTKLLKVTEEALHLGIEQACYGNRLSDISHAIQAHAEKAGFSVVRELVGHGIGRALHEEPQVPNFGKPGRGPRLRPGMVMAIEPMVNIGTHRVSTDDDGWTVRSADRSVSAHFEHTIVVREDGAEILTQGR